MGIGETARAVLGTGTPLRCPNRISLSRSAGWMSVMGEPGVCDEKSRQLEVEIQLATRRAELLKKVRLRP
jgi:hypothetical protein